MKKFLVSKNGLATVKNAPYFMGIFFSIEFGILFGLGVLLLARFFRHKLYVSWSKYVYSGV